MNIHHHQRSSYRLLGLVGNGQFGRVYCGVHRKTGQLVAIKYLHRNSLSTQSFLRELHCLLRLSHPNIVACHALEHAEDGRKLVLEYCAGGTLRSHMLSPLSLIDILSLTTDTLCGLAHAHQQGVIHCDIKPENILLSYYDGRWRAKLSDFGIAKLTQKQPGRFGSGQTGSPAYMAPERFYRQYSSSADVYAVGILLFELLVGQRPFTGTPAELQSAHLNQPVPKIDRLGEPLKHIVTKALEKLPARRYPTATEMLADLKQIDHHDLGLVNPLDLVQSTYAFYAGAPVHRLTQPVHHLKKLSSDPLDTAATTVQTLMACGPQLAVFQQKSLTVSNQSLDSPAQGLYPSKNGLIVATQNALWRGSNYKSLTLLTRWQTPAMVAVAPQNRWVAMVVDDTKQLTITPLSGSGVAAGSRRRPLPPDIDLDQVLALNEGHLAVMGRSQHGSQLLLWNRRGMYLTSLNLGITLRRLTPMRQPYQWMAIDANAPQTIILLTLKPLRMTRIRIDIRPDFILDLPWGYLFSNKNGRMLLLDRDFHPIGGIQGPHGITALTSVSDNALLVATWQNGATGDGELHQLNLQNFELDMIF